MLTKRLSAQYYVATLAVNVTSVTHVGPDHDCPGACTSSGEKDASVHDVRISMSFPLAFPRAIVEPASALVPMLSSRLSPTAAATATLGVMPFFSLYLPIVQGEGGGGPED